MTRPGLNLIATGVLVIAVVVGLESASGLGPRNRARVPSSGASEGQMMDAALSAAAVISPTATTTVSPAVAPRSIMIVGDSGMFDVSLALEALYRQMGTQTVLNVSYPGFGLTKAPFEWLRDWPPLVARARPTLVIAMVGGWDIQWEQQRGYGKYQAVLSEAGAIMSSTGARVLWLGMPPGGKAQLEPLDSILAGFSATHAQYSAYADPAPVLEGPGGFATRWLVQPGGTRVLARKPDGWHFCPDGAVLVARFAATQAAELGWAPPPVTGWEYGVWRSDLRYHQPPGECDSSTAPG